MCNPLILAAATFAVSAASAVSSHVSQVQQAKTQDAIYQRNARAANEAAIQDYANLGLRQQQEQIAGEQERQQSTLEARQAAATTRVAAGEAGISGLSVNALLMDIYGQDARYRDSVRQQEEWTVDQLQREKEGVKASAIDRTNSVQPGQRPSFVDLGLRIGAAGLDSYNTYSRYKSPYGTTAGARSRTAAGTSAGRFMVS